MFPCTSDIEDFGMPDLKCNPSQFWDTMCLTKPELCNSANAIWVFVGSAADKSWFL